MGLSQDFGCDRNDQSLSHATDLGGQEASHRKEGQTAFDGSWQIDESGVLPLSFSADTTLACAEVELQELLGEEMISWLSTLAE